MFLNKSAMSGLPPPLFMIVAICFRRSLSHSVALCSAGLASAATSRRLNAVLVTSILSEPVAGSNTGFPSESFS